MTSSRVGMGLIAIILALLAVIGCTDASITRDRERTNDQLQQYQRNQPIPVFNFSQERDTVIQLYVMRNENRQTYTVITSQGTGATIFECPSRGTAIAADTQITNGLQAIGSNGAVVEQAEPNGLYSSKNTDATWILCVRPNGEIAPVYTEQKVTQFPFVVQRDDATGRYMDAGQGQSSMRIELNRAGQ